MPCFTERQVTVDLQAANEGVLERGLTAAGFTVRKLRDGLSVSKGYSSARIINGQVTVLESAEHLVNEIKQAYAHEAVRTVAKQYGWKQMQDKYNPQRTVLKSRYS